MSNLLQYFRDNDFAVEEKIPVLIIPDKLRQEFLTWRRENDIPGRWIRVPLDVQDESDSQPFFIPNIKQYLFTMMYWSDKINS
jgi:hypothetical protein